MSKAAAVKGGGTKKKSTTPAAAPAGAARSGWLPAHVGATVLIGYAMLLLVKLSNSPDVRPRYFIDAGVTVGALAVVYGVARLSRSQADRALLAATMLLASLGMLVRFRLGAASAGLGGGLAWLVYPLGVACMLAVWMAFRHGRVAGLEKVAIPSALAAIGILAVILVVGRRFRGMVYMPGQSNPSELVKPLLVVFLAGFAARHRHALEQSQVGLPAPPLGVTFGLGVLWGVPMVLLLLQRDLGMIVLMNVVCFGLLYLATGRRGYAVVAVAVAVAAGALLFHIPVHGQRRLLAWLNPFGAPTGNGWQILQALSALYSGGLGGAGLGCGAPDSIPIASSDFVYAAIGEELGFVGCGLLLLGYLVLIRRGLAAGEAASTPFARLLGAGLALLLACQTLLNVGGVTKAIPLTGITLPFISQGGSSLLTSFGICGLLLALSDDAPTGSRASPARRRRR